MCPYPPVADVSIVQSSCAQWDNALDMITAALIFFPITLLELPFNIVLLFLDYV